MIFFVGILSLFAVGISGLAAYPLYRVGQMRQAAILGTTLLVFSSLLYVYWGAPRIVPAAAEHHARMQDLREIIKVSEAIIQKEPRNLEAWLNLAQAFADSGDYAAAANGYKQTVLLSKGNPLLITAYAEALIATNNGLVTDQAKRSLDIALMIDKELPAARYYKAIWLLQQGQQQEAMGMMKALYHELPEDSALKRKINEQIGR